MSEPIVDGVTVTGLGRVSVRPDLLVARLGAEVTAGSVQAALDACSGAGGAIASAVRAAGVADADLSTSAASVYAAYDDRGQVRGWTASQSLVARLRDLSTAGEVVSAALAAAGDAGRLHDLSLVVDDDRTARGEARRLAFADATASAEIYGELAGRRLGPVRALREVAGQGGGGGGMVMRAFAGDSGGMPVEAGNQEVTVTVEARWDLLG